MDQSSIWRVTARVCLQVKREKLYRLPLRRVDRLLGLSTFDIERLHRDSSFASRFPGSFLDLLVGGILGQIQAGIESLLVWYSRTTRRHFPLSISRLCL
jgi:hypothetical protein